VNGARGEADIDVEYSSAAAPDADILLVSCDAGFPNGIIAALKGTLEMTTPPPPSIISISYNECEAQLGSTKNTTIYNLYLSATAMGISVFSIAGDALGYMCDGNGATYSTLGLSVNGFGSTQWNVAVGGTDFMDSYSNQVSTYWNPNNTMTTNYMNWSSARSYIPEIPWNTSCASELIASAFKFATTYGPNGLCNNVPIGYQYFYNEYAGTGAGTSTLYPLPLWQRPFVPAGTTHRLLNDVSMFASAGTAAIDPAGNGVWGHAFRLCDSNYTCNSTPTDWPEFDGTSFASPIWAGIEALINQRAGGRRQGLPTPTYYLLAGLTVTVHPGGGCDSSRPGGPSGSCVFHDVTQGDDDGPCQAGTPNCYSPGAPWGVLSTSTTSYQPAFKAGVGWDFPTGLGTPNVYGLVLAWPPLSGLLVVAAP
jgi:subtilase family serine protease